MDSNDCLKAYGWDETMFIKCYYKSLKLAGEDIARQIAKNTNGPIAKNLQINNSYATIDFKVGDYVRATYEADGCDYEAKIISVDLPARSCVIKYIGYENEETVLLKDLVSSWGKKYRRLQYEKSKDTISAVGVHNKSNGKDTRACLVPPPPPVPAMLNQNVNESEHLSAMLMAWYMSGYYTGVYEGSKISKKKNGI